MTVLSVLLVPAFPNSDAQLYSQGKVGKEPTGSVTGKYSLAIPIMLACPSFPPFTSSPRGNMELYRLSNSHSEADTNGMESETQMLALDLQGLPGGSRRASMLYKAWGDHDIFSTVEQLSLVFSWLDYTLGFWQWKEGENLTNVMA